MTAVIWTCVALLICGWGAAGMCAVYVGKRFDEKRDRKFGSPIEVLWR
jgi:hypothetical protein